MDDYPDRPERLEPLRTLHETRANDQYGKSHNHLQQDDLTVIVEALVFEIPAKLASRVLG